MFFFLAAAGSIACLCLWGWLGGGEGRVRREEGREQAGGEGAIPVEGCVRVVGVRVWCVGELRSYSPPARLMGEEGTAKADRGLPRLQRWRWGEERRGQHGARQPQDTPPGQD